MMTNIDDVVMVNKTQSKTSTLREVARAVLSLIAVAAALALLVHLPPY